MLILNLKKLRFQDIEVKFFVLLLLMWSCSSCHSVNSAQEDQRDSSYKVVAYYWPAYHDEPRWRPFFSGTEGEWEIIRNSKPKYDGHRQPRIPVWGYEDESNPAVMEKKINAAVSHGVNVWAFDWYWYEHGPFLEDCINKGFLKAENNRKIEFYIMWANHDATTLWDLRRSKNHDIIWTGAVDRKDFDIITDRIIDRYMKQPNYFKINGEPVFAIYELGTLIHGLGGMQQTKDALDDFRRKVKEAGFPGLHLQSILWSNVPVSVSNVPGDTVETQNNTIRELGINSLTNYQFVHVSAPVDHYLDWGNTAIANWAKWDEEFSVPFFPHVSIDWDTNPRFYDYKPNIKEGVTPENFKMFLKKAKAYLDNHPSQPRMVTINSWNEWSEGSYLEPDSEHKMEYLEAVKEVFGSK